MRKTATHHDDCVPSLTTHASDDEATHASTPTIQCTYHICSYTDMLATYVHAILA
jgi:hypothetical protein